jgi:ribosomal protein S19
MSRSSKKGLFIDKHLMKKASAAKASDSRKPIKT